MKTFCTGYIVKLLPSNLFLLLFKVYKLNKSLDERDVQVKVLDKELNQLKVFISLSRTSEDVHEQIERFKILCERSKQLEVLHDEDRERWKIIREQLVSYDGLTLSRSLLYRQLIPQVHRSFLDDSRKEWLKTDPQWLVWRKTIFLSFQILIVAPIIGCFNKLVTGFSRRIL
jgi:hypothetical protein